MSRKNESQSIILAIRGVGESYLAQQRRKEGTWRSESVNAQGIVGSVLVSPLVVIDESWGQGVQLEVAHAIRANHHRCILLIETLHNLLQRTRRRIEVVAIQLNGESSATIVVDGLVPASAYAQIGALGYDVHQSLIVETLQQLGGAVGRVIIHHDDVVFKARFLSEGTVHGITDGLLAIIDGDDD